MCGILGFIATYKPISRAEFIQCLRKLRHRGQETAGLAWFGEHDGALTFDSEIDEETQKKRGLSTQKGLTQIHWSTCLSKK